MTGTIKLVTTAAAVVLAAVIGVSLATGTGQTGVALSSDASPDAGASPSPISAAIPNQSPSPSPIFAAQSVPFRPMGRLVYERDGDIYLADPDGGNPARVAPGEPGDGPEGPDFFLARQSIWAPDGRHFLYLESGAHGRAHVSDAVGREVASFANVPFTGFGGVPTWSPDSTRLQAWTDASATDTGLGNTGIGVYGIDGALQTVLHLPDGYMRFRESLGVWGPDGRSVWVLITRDGGNREVWELPTDGSAPERVAEDLTFTTLDLSFAHDGSRMAFSGGSQDPDDLSLNVANSDGSGASQLVKGQGMNPVWSPNGSQLAYSTFPGDEDHRELRVVDVTTGIARTLVADTSLDGYSWSRYGDRILFLAGGGPGTGSLWSVGFDGGEPTLLVEGASQGEWQPAPPAAAPSGAAPAWTPPPKAVYAAHMVAALDELQRAWTANEDITFKLDNEEAWVGDRLPAAWKGDSDIAAYIDALHVLARVAPATPAWDEAWARYFATRGALASVVPDPPRQVLPSEACALTVKWVHVYDDMGSGGVETVLDPPPLGGPYRVSMDEDFLGRPAAYVAANGERWGPEFRVSITAADGTGDSYGLNTPVRWHALFFDVGLYVVELSSAQNECKATLVFEVLAGPIPTPAP